LLDRIEVAGRIDGGRLLRDPAGNAIVLTPRGGPA
jgi:hypothetical protein